MRNLLCLSCLFLTFQFSSCEKEDVLTPESQPRGRVDTEIRVGEKVESPFLLRNMQRAVDSLSSRSGLKSLTVLEPTHLYVRFLPADTSEYDRLVSDTTLDFTAYPLDYELTEGDSYHDPSLPMDAIPWQYTVVPADYELDKFGVRHEIMDELYILDEDLEREDISVQGASLRSGSFDRLSWKKVVDEALTQMGYQGKNTLRSKWTPCATIKAYDDLLGKYIPLQGVKVRIRYFAFLKAYHYTDANGYVSFGSKRTSVEYSIEWERDMWDIRNGGVQAYYNGPDQKSKWNLNIGSGSPKSLHNSAIHRALYKYYYGDCCGLMRPSKSLKVNLDESKIDGPNGSTKYFTVQFLNGVLSSIWIYGLDKNSNYKPASKVFSTTLHELTHASHCCFVGYTQYVKTDLIVREAMALAGQWVLTKDEYKMLDRKKNVGYDDLLDFIECQDWPYNQPNREHKRSLEYSPLMIDMMDDYNQNEEAYKPLKDNIAGYQLYSFQRSMRTISSIADFKNHLTGNRPASLSNPDLVDYFNQFEKYYELYK